MDDLRKIDDLWIRFVSAFSLFCRHFRASTTKNDLRATLAPRVLSSIMTQRRAMDTNECQSQWKTNTNRVHASLNLRLYLRQQ